ncbi:MAG: aminotransferase class I/II-fold pyridoxal phosphate-dependent enzyme [Promethearchaeota archaeon]
MEQLGQIIIDGLKNMQKIKKVKARLTQCNRWISQVKSHNLFYWYRGIEDPSGREVDVNGRKMIMMGSYDYLGLSQDPEVKKAVSEAALKYGSSTGGPRLLSGTMQLHEELESAIAEFKGTEAAVSFNSGYLTNLTAVSTLFSKGDLIILDKFDHTSIYDGAKLSGAETKIFWHNNIEALEEILETSDSYNNVLLVLDAVYSAIGDLAPLPKMVELAKKYNAILYLDEAHCIGVIGEKGKGIDSHFGMNTKEVDIWMGTCSKAMASIGGYIAGNEELVNFLKFFANGIVFSGSPPATVTAAIIAALDIMKKDDSRLNKLWKNIEQYKSGLNNMGYDTMGTESAIVPILIKNESTAIRMAQYLDKEGIFTCPFIYPAVPRNTARFRTCMTANHTSEQINRVLDVFEKAGKKFGLL